MSHLKLTALSIQGWYFFFPIALLLEQPGCLPVGWLWAVPLWSSPGSVGSPIPALSWAFLCCQHGRPQPRLQQVGSSFAELQHYFFSLHLVLSLAVQPELLGLKPALFLPAEVKKLSISWDLVLRCELWSSGWMFTRSPVVSLCTVQSIVHF